MFHVSIHCRDVSFFSKSVPVFLAKIFRAQYLEEEKNEAKLPWIKSSQSSLLRRSAPDLNSCRPKSATLRTQRLSIKQLEAFKLP